MATTIGGRVQTLAVLEALRRHVLHRVAPIRHQIARTHHHHADGIHPASSQTRQLHAAHVCERRRLYRTVRQRSVFHDVAPCITWHITQVTSNEPVNGKGDGNTAPDWQILGNHTVALRAERSGNGSGRIYTITIQASDANGNLSDPKTVTVTVPKSQGKKK